MTSDVTSRETTCRETTTVGKTPHDAAFGIRLRDRWCVARHTRHDPLRGLGLRHGGHLRLRTRLCLPYGCTDARRCHLLVHDGA